MMTMCVGLAPTWKETAFVPEAEAPFLVAVKAGTHGKMSDAFCAGRAERRCSTMLAIEMDAEVVDLGLAVHPHPALSNSVRCRSRRRSLVELHDGAR